jgi:signal transduction histidine kinase
MQEMASQAGVILRSVPQRFETYADHDRLLQVLINLLSNAIKFSQPGGVVTLSVKKIRDDGTKQYTLDREGTDAPMLLFSVKDQGRGLPADKLESIFERFHQVDASDSREKGGTGLGLAICRSIVQQHQGTIWAESILGQGSTFYFTLPLQENQHGT